MSSGAAQAWSREFDKGFNAFYWYNHSTSTSVWEASLDQPENITIRKEIYGYGAASDEGEGEDDDGNEDGRGGEDGQSSSDSSDDDDDDEDEELDQTEEQSFQAYLLSEEGKHDMEMELKELEKKFYRRKEIALEKRRIKIEKRKQKYSKNIINKTVIIGLEDVEIGADDRREVGIDDDDIDSISTNDANVQDVLSPNFPLYLQWKPVSRYVLKKTGFYIPGDANALYDDFSFKNFVLLSVLVMKNAFLIFNNSAIAAVALVRSLGKRLLSVLLTAWVFVNKGIISPGNSTRDSGKSKS